MLGKSGASREKHAVCSGNYCTITARRHTTHEKAAQTERGLPEGPADGRHRACRWLSRGAIRHARGSDGARAMQVGGIGHVGGCSEESRAAVSRSCLRVAAVFRPALSSGRRCLRAATVFGPPLSSGRRCLWAAAVFGPPLSSGCRCLPAAAVFRPLSVADSSWRYGPQSVTVPSVTGSRQSRAAVSRRPQSVTGSSEQSRAAVSRGQ